MVVVASYEGWEVIRLKCANYLNPGDLVMLSPSLWLMVISINNINGRIAVKFEAGRATAFDSGEMVIYDDSDRP